MTGGIGSVLLDRCGWQSVFYFSGGLTLLWVYYVYKYLLDEKGNCSPVASPSASCFKHRSHKLFLGRVNKHPLTQQGANSRSKKRFHSGIAWSQPRGDGDDFLQHLPSRV